MRKGPWRFRPGISMAAMAALFFSPSLFLKCTNNKRSTVMYFEIKTYGSGPRNSPKLWSLEKKIVVAVNWNCKSALMEYIPYLFKDFKSFTNTKAWSIDWSHWLIHTLFIFYLFTVYLLTYWLFCLWICQNYNYLL